MREYLARLTENKWLSQIEIEMENLCGVSKASFEMNKKSLLVMKRTSSDVYSAS